MDGALSDKNLERLKMIDPKEFEGRTRVVVGKEIPIERGMSDHIARTVRMISSMLLE